MQSVVQMDQCQSAEPSYYGFRPRPPPGSPANRRFTLLSGGYRLLMNPPEGTSSVKAPGSLRHFSRLMRFAIALPCSLFMLHSVLASPSRACAQDTAYPAVDAEIPGPATPSDRQAWLADLRHWRTERLSRIGYDGSNYLRPELRWTQRNFVCVQMMIEERTFFDPERARYTVDAYLNSLEKEFGGVDSVLIWNTYPNLGVDDRNQFDRLRDMPGGIPGVRQMVADFHRRGVRVLFPETPWDFGTREEGAADWAIQAQLMKEVGADGLLGDTMDGVPHAYLLASDKVGHPLALQPEGLPPEEDLAWNEMSWGYWSYPFVPMVSRYKWLESRHMPVLTSGGRHHIDGMQSAFFNGVGYADQEDVIGLHNGFTPREAEALRRRYEYRAQLRCTSCQSRLGATHRDIAGRHLRKPISWS